MARLEFVDLQDFPSHRGKWSCRTPLEREYEYYLSIREELAEEHDGKFVAIWGQKILGIYENYMEAASDVYAEHERGTVLMQEIRKDVNSLVVTFHSPGVPIL